MVLGVMEGQIRGGYFPDYILDPSVIDCTPHLTMDTVGNTAEVEQFEECVPFHLHFLKDPSKLSSSQPSLTAVVTAVTIVPRYSLGLVT